VIFENGVARTLLDSVLIVKREEPAPKQFEAQRAPWLTTAIKEAGSHAHNEDLKIPDRKQDVPGSKISNVESAGS